VLRELSQPPPAEAKFSVGEITERSLAYYNGRDWAKPLLLAIKGVVYDITDAMDTYGPGEGSGGGRSRGDSTRPSRLQQHCSHRSSAVVAANHLEAAYSNNHAPALGLRTAGCTLLCACPHQPPGKELSAYAGRECARAIAKGSKEPKDVGSADLADCSPEELKRLEEKLEELRSRKCLEAGKVRAWLYNPVGCVQVCVCVCVFGREVGSVTMWTCVRARALRCVIISGGRGVGDVCRVGASAGRVGDGGGVLVRVFWKCSVRVRMLQGQNSSMRPWRAQRTATWPFSLHGCFGLGGLGCSSGQGAACHIRYHEKCGKKTL
jgi:hypothetical protein